MSCALFKDHHVQKSVENVLLEGRIAALNGTWHEDLFPL